MNSVFKILDNQLHLHDSMDSLEEGWAYCNCHPETCSHFDGKYYAGKPEPFKLEGYHLQQYEKYQNDRTYQTQEETERLLKKFDIPFTTTHAGKIDIPGVRMYGISVQIEEYKEAHFYKVEYIMDAILGYKSKQRKQAWNDFQKML